MLRGVLWMNNSARGTDRTRSFQVPPRYAEVRETESMADGKEEREERKACLEEKKKDLRRGDGYDEETVYEGQPEKGGS